MNYMSGREQAEQQAEAQAAAIQQERVRASQEMRNVRLRQGQQRMALANEMEEGARRANMARATAQVAAGEAGIGGRAAELQQQDINVQNARYQHALQQQSSENDFAAELQLENAAMRTQMNQQRMNQPIEQPSLLEAGLGIISGVAQAQVQEANYEMATGTPMTLANLTGISGLNIGGTGDSNTAYTEPAIEPVAAYTPVKTYAPTNFKTPSLDIDLPSGDGYSSGSLLPNV